MTRSKKFIINGKEYDHLHLSELPKKIIRKDTDAQKYRDDTLRTLQSLQYAYERLAVSAQICYLNIDSITSTKPYMPTSSEVYNSVQDFVYHYENYSMRVFILREKVLRFINAALPVDWPEREVKVGIMLNHTTVKSAKLDTLIKKFASNSGNPLGTLVKGRNQLTHELYYPKTDHYLRPPRAVEADTDTQDYKEYFRQWKKRIKDKETIVTQAAAEMIDLNHELSEKIYEFRESDISK